MKNLKDTILEDWFKDLNKLKSEWIYDQNEVKKICKVRTELLSRKLNIKGERPDCDALGNTLEKGDVLLIIGTRGTYDIGVFYGVVNGQQFIYEYAYADIENNKGKAWGIFKGYPDQVFKTGEKIKLD